MTNLLAGDMRTVIQETWTHDDKKRLLSLFRCSAVYIPQNIQSPLDQATARPGPGTTRPGPGSASWDVISYYYRYNLLFFNCFIILLCRCQSCESLPAQILDLCTEIWLTTASVLKDRLCIKQACLMNTVEQGRQFEHYYAHYLFYYSNCFDSLLRI